jgi:hypothetical protein
LLLLLLLLLFREEFLEATRRGDCGLGIEFVMLVGDNILTVAVMVD